MKTLASFLAAGLALALAGCNTGGNTTNATISNTTVTTTTTMTPTGGATTPAGPDWTQTVSQTAEGFVMGNPNAPIKLVEYGSRLCPTCKALADQGYASLTQNYVRSGKVSFEFREFLVHGAPDVAPALLGRCVGTAAFFPMLEQMFASQDGFNERLRTLPAATQQQIQAAATPAEAFQRLADALGIIDFVKARGMPEAQARACIGDQAQIDRLIKQTQDNGPRPAGSGMVMGTPTLLINGRVAKDVITWPALEQALKDAGA